MGRWQTIGLLTKDEGFPVGTTGVAELGGGVKLAPRPTLLAKPGFADWLQSCFGREEFDLSGYAFVYEYEASGLGDPDPDEPKRAKQDAALERIQLASIALWLSQVIRPSFSAYAHAPLEMEGGAEAWSARRVEPIIPNQLDGGFRLNETRERTIREITARLLSLPRPSPLWTAVRFLLFGLRERKADTRITMLWIALEALFGEIDTERGTSKELYRRIAGFFGATRKEQLEAHEIAKVGWKVRCSAVHGGRTADMDPKILLVRILEAESMLRTALNRILREPTLLVTFSEDRSREVFAASKSFEFTVQDGMSAGRQVEVP
jgi:hypothetical protein